jgi:hypothetical protein
MAETAIPHIFQHRLNRNSDFDSVCLDCLLIVSSERSEVDLKFLEISHHCDPVLLDLLWGRKRHFN